MAYGTIKVDTITFTDAGIDKSVTISGLVQNPTFTGNVTVTGTVSGATANFVSGVFTTQISGATVTGGNANFTSGTFTNISGGVYTITSGVFALGTSGTPSISFASDPNTGIYSPGADQVAISTNGTPRITVQSDGNVLIGATGSANRLLTVNQTGITGGEYGISVSQTSATSNALELTIDSANAVSKLFQKSTIPLVFGTNDTERMRLDSSGRLGLGTSSPAQLLETQDGNIQIRNSVTLSENTLSPYGLTFRNANQLGQDRGTIAAIKPYLAGAGDNDFGLQFLTQATTAGGVTTKMTLTPGGSLGIGTTEPLDTLSIAAANYRGLTLETSTLANRPTITFRNTGGSGDSAYIQGNNYELVFGRVNQDYGGHTEHARIDGSGRLLVGTSNARSNFFNSTTTPFDSARLQVEGTTYEDAAASLVCNSSTAGVHPIFVLAKSNGESLGSNILVSSNTILGMVSFQGNDGSEFVPAANITAEVDGTPGANDMPGRLVFSVTADGASSPTEAMRIKNSRIINIANTPVYADNAAAKTGGLVDGDVYRTSTGDLKIVYT